MGAFPPGQGSTFLIVLEPMAEEPQLRRTQRWEHDIFFWNDPTPQSGERVDIAMRAMLAARGNEGWELVAVTEGRPRTYTFFSNVPPRPKGEFGAVCSRRLPPPWLLCHALLDAQELE